MKQTALTAVYIAAVLAGIGVAAFGLWHVAQQPERRPESVQRMSRAIRTLAVGMRKDEVERVLSIESKDSRILDPKDFYKFRYPIEGEWVLVLSYGLTDVVKKTRMITGKPEEFGFVSASIWRGYDLVETVEP